MKEIHNFSTDLRLQVLSKGLQPNLQKPKLDVLFPKYFMDSTESVKIDKNGNTFEIAKNENSIEKDQKEAITVNLTQSTQSLEDLNTNNSSDGNENLSLKISQPKQIFGRRNLRKGMTLMIEPKKKDNNDTKKKLQKTCLKILKEKKFVLKCLEQTMKLISKISHVLKEVIEEEYSKGNRFFFINIINKISD